MVLSHSWFPWVLVRITILWICVAMTGKLVLRFGGVAAEIIVFTALECMAQEQKAFQVFLLVTLGYQP